MATPQAAVVESPLFGGVLHAQHFETDQYVRVHLGNGRTEIGVVSMTDGVDGQITVTTRHGYDVTVRPSCVRRAFLIVLDLNGVLGARGRGSFIHRPHVEEFVKFVFSNFVVAVWTSGLERSCGPIIDSVFKGYRDKLLFTLYRDACTSRSTAANPYGTVKNLQRIFDTYPKSFHSVNTIIIDDSPDKCSHPDIALCPVPFRDPVAQRGDDGLLKVIEVLGEVLQVDSHLPLIRVAEERARRLALQAGTANEDRSDTREEDVMHVVRRTNVATSSCADDSCVVDAHPNPPHDPTGDEAGAFTSAEVQLWKTRLCCEYLRGVCHYGTACRFSHDADDGKRPCNHKDRCTHGHSSRWVRITEEAKHTEAVTPQLRVARAEKDAQVKDDKIDRDARPQSRVGDTMAALDTHPNQGWAIEHLSTLLMASRDAQPTLTTATVGGGHFGAEQRTRHVVNSDQCSATHGAATSGGRDIPSHHIPVWNNVTDKTQSRAISIGTRQTVFDIHRGDNGGSGTVVETDARPPLRIGGTSIHITASASDERSLVKQLMKLTKS